MDNYHYVFEIENKIVVADIVATYSDGVIPHKAFYFYEDYSSIVGWKRHMSSDGIPGKKYYELVQENKNIRVVGERYGVWVNHKA